MSAALLLDELRTLGVKVWPDAGALRFKAPAGAITPDLTARLKSFKPELLAILAENAAANDDMQPLRSLPQSMRGDFEACMKALKPEDERPFRSDLHDVIREYGTEYAEQWIRNWRETLLVELPRISGRGEHVRAELPLVRDLVKRAESRTQ